jgi:hypothetical protein
MDSLSHFKLAVHCDHIIKVICNNPQDLLILDQLAQDRYCIHLRQPMTWPYVGIMKYWFDEWTHTMASSPNQRLVLTVEAVVRTTLVHKLAHWILALVSKFCWHLVKP